MVKKKYRLLRVSVIGIHNLAFCLEGAFHVLNRCQSILPSLKEVHHPPIFPWHSEVRLCGLPMCIPSSLVLWSPEMAYQFISHTCCTRCMTACTRWYPIPVPLTSKVPHVPAAVSANCSQLLPDRTCLAKKCLEVATHVHTPARGHTGQFPRDQQTQRY